MFLGIDIGSSSSKAALMDNDGKLLGTKVVNIGTGTNGIEIALSELLKEQGCTEEDILYTVATGYGRMTYRKPMRRLQRSAVTQRVLCQSIRRRAASSTSADRMPRRSG